MNTTIEVFSRSVYGEHRTYAADKEQADALGKITGNKTLTAAHIDGLKQLGFAFVLVIDPKAFTFRPVADR